MNKTTCSTSIIPITHNLGDEKRKLNIRNNKLLQYSTVQYSSKSLSIIAMQCNAEIQIAMPY